MSGLPGFMPVEWIEAKRLNSNVMRGDRYENTKRDIERNGIQEKLRLIPRDIYTGDPGEPHDRYVIEDGNQRYRIALELGIEAVPYEIVERGEAESLARNYRLQANRGEQDPLMEAEMLQYYLDRGLTQEQVVEKLGLTNRAYLTDRIALLKLSEEVREVVTDFPKAVEHRVRQRMYGEDEETVKELIEEIVARATITLRHLREVSPLPESHQIQVVNAMLDTFIEGGTVSTRQVAAMVKEIRDRIDRDMAFTKAWEEAKIKDCPTCSTPPLNTAWDEEAHTFTCTKGHAWRYDKTPEEQEEEKRRLEEEAAQRRRAQDTTLIEIIVNEAGDPYTLIGLQTEFYALSDYYEFEAAKKAVNQYLEDHPEVQLRQPPTPQEPETQRLEDEIRDQAAHPVQSTAQGLEEQGTALEDEESDGGLEEDGQEEGGLEAKPDDEPHLELGITAQELHQRLAQWIVRKLGQLTDIESIRLTGFRGQEQIRISYDVPDHKGRATFSFTRGATEPGPVEGTRTVTGWDWFTFDTEQQRKDLTVTAGKHDADAGYMGLVSRFIEHAPHADADPWEIDGEPEGDDDTPHNEVVEEQCYEPNEEPEPLPTCPRCGKVSPNPSHCSSCGAPMKELVVV